MKKYNKIVAIQGDPIPSINKKTDTTLLLALEAQRRGYKIYYYETKNLNFLNNKVYALSKEVKFNEQKRIEYRKKIGSELNKKNVLFPGINLMSNYLTSDLNITSTTRLKKI